VPKGKADEERRRPRRRGESWLSWQRSKRVSKRLLQSADDAEVIVDEVHHHWVVYTLPVLEMLGALIVLYVLLVSPPRDGVLLLAVAAALAGHAAWQALNVYMDVFVITDLRVFRVTGVTPLTTKKQASTPLSRILDITVSQPPLGQLLGYGHFTFESAAQEQGLRDIKFVTDPMHRDKLIQGQQMELLRRQRRNQRSS
jgi:PH (Pleckstrin Homology) domain-containing protein